MDKGGWFIDSHNGNIKDDYHFIEKIASGGFGIVYLAEHRKTGKLSIIFTILTHTSFKLGNLHDIM
jgi:serine/threonine protein kinase